MVFDDIKNTYNLLDYVRHKLKGAPNKHPKIIILQYKHVEHNSLIKNIITFKKHLRNVFKQIEICLFQCMVLNFEFEVSLLKKKTRYNNKIYETYESITYIIINIKFSFFFCK